MNSIQEKYRQITGQTQPRRVRATVNASGATARTRSTSTHSASTREGSTEDSTERKSSAGRNGYVGSRRRGKTRVSSPASHHFARYRKREAKRRAQLAYRRRERQMASLIKNALLEPEYFGEDGETVAISRAYTRSEALRRIIAFDEQLTGEPSQIKLQPEDLSLAHCYYDYHPSVGEVGWILWTGAPEKMPQGNPTVEVWVAYLGI